MPLSLDEVADGLTNMALDAALLEQAEADGQVWGRVYGWSAPWVTLGRFQLAARDLLPHCPVPSVVRPTGGRAVLHGHDLTIGLAGPLVLGRHGSVRGSLRETYRVYARLIIEALRSQGIPVALGEEVRFPKSGAGILPALDECGMETADPQSTRFHLGQLETDQIPSQRSQSEAGERGQDARATLGRSADCFAHVAANDVVDERTGVKVCGCALRMTDRAVLLQASIPIGPPLIEPDKVFAEPSPSSFVELERGAFCREFERVILSADRRAVER